MTHNKRRRMFLEHSLLAGLTAVFATTGVGKVMADTRLLAGDVSSPTDQLFAIRATNNLYEPPVEIQVGPGEVSPPIRLSGGFIYRVRVSPLDRVTPFGKSYRLQLLDGEGKNIDEMNVGSNTTATFKRFGVQIYLLSMVQHAGAVKSEI